MVHSALVAVTGAPLFVKKPAVLGSPVLHKLERTLGRYAIRNLTMILIAGQAITYAIGFVKPLFLEKITLVPGLVLAEPWRLLTWVFYPPTGGFLFLPETYSPIFVLFAFYMFWLMGGALEEHWGAFRYNLFLFVGYLSTVAAAMLVPGGPVTNEYLGGSVFLAFAFLHPDFQLLLFFILPVKVKWIALLTWLGYLWALIFDDWTSRALVLAATLNFLLFFGKELLTRAKYGKRRMETQVQGARVKGVDLAKARHRCIECGITEQSHPGMQFRYVPDENGARCYCMDHLPVKKSVRPPAANG